MLKKINLTLTAFLLTFPAALAMAEANSLEAYYRTLTYGCEQDSDCKVKQVYNCCGSMTMCVLETVEPNKELVENICKQQSLVGICGFVPVTSCRCIKQNCENQVPIAQ